MERRQVVVDNPVTVGGTTLIPMARVSLNCWCGKSAATFFGNKQPTAVAVISRTVRKAFRITGEEISLDALVEEVDGLQRILDML